MLMNTLNRGGWDTLKSTKLLRSAEGPHSALIFPSPSLLKGKALLFWAFASESAFELGKIASDSKTDTLSLLRAGSPWRMGLCLMPHFYQLALPWAMPHFKMG